MIPIIDVLKNRDLPHGAHSDHIEDTKDVVQEGFELICDKMAKDIIKFLKQEKLVKSDVQKIVREIPKITIDLSRLETVIQDHLNCIKFMFLGRAGGKNVFASVKKLGLIGKIPSGVIYGAYLHAIDVQREYYKQLYGQEPNSIPEDILEFALHLMNSKTARALEQNIIKFKLSMMDAMQKQADLLNKKNEMLGRDVAFEAKDNGKKTDIVEDLVADAISGKISMRDAKKAIRESFDQHEDSFNKMLNTEMQIASASANHMAVSELFGGFDQDLRVAIVNIRDERCCDSCEKFSRNPDGSLKLYNLSELAPSGNNLSVKKAQWKASIPPVHFNCYSACTEVLTKRGWIKWPEATIDDIYFSINLETGDAEWVKAKNYIKYFFEGSIEHRHSKSFSLCTVPNHNHVVSKRIRDWTGDKGTGLGYRWELVNLSEIKYPKESYFLGAVPNWSGKTCEKIEISSKGKTYSFDAISFCRFMGMYLSEGNCSKIISKVKKTASYHVKITQQKYYDLFLEEISKFSLCKKAWPAKNKDCIQFAVESEFGEWLRSFGHSHEKYIPNEIKELNKELIEEFLEYFRLGGGSFVKNPTLPSQKSETFAQLYRTSSVKMAADLGEMLIKLGTGVSYYTQEPKTTVHKNGTYTSNHVLWTVYRRTASVWCNAAVKTDLIPYSNFVYDVELEKNNTLAVRHNGKVVISGNCRCVIQYIPQGFSIDEQGTIYKSKEIK